MDVKKAFLQQSYNDNWDIYVKTLEKGTSIPKWDYFIITASNEEQAKAYRLQLEHRRKSGFLPEDTKFLVIPDPDGKRIGSGGATLNALYECYCNLQGEEKNPFLNKRILIIHSGGDSKRIPQYSAFGKLFSKVPRELPDGRYSTLFDEFLISLSGLPSRMKEGLVIASGDVLLLFNHNQIDLGRQGAVGIGIKVPVSLGTHHGVYVSGKASKVHKFLHKMPEDVLIKEGAVNHQGYVDVDTGLIWMDADIIYDMLGLIMTNSKLDMDKYNRFVNDHLRLNFYGDFIIPLTSSALLESYLREDSEGVYCEELLEVRKNIWKVLNNHTMYVQALSPAEFIHFGTTEEFRDLMSKIDIDYKFLSWSKNVVSYRESNKDSSDICLMNSLIGKNVCLGNNVVVEDSRLMVDCHIGNGCVISNLMLNDGIELEDNLVLHQLPVIEENGKTEYVTRIYGVMDNPKNTLESGKTTFLNRSLNDMLTASGVKWSDLWIEGQERNLWNAKLYPVCSDRKQSLNFTVLLSRFESMSDAEKSQWLSTKRVSLKESYEIANQYKIIQIQDSVEDEIRAKKFINMVNGDVWVKEAYEVLGNNFEMINRRLNIVFDNVKNFEGNLQRARIYRAAAEVLKYFSGNRFKAVSSLNWRELEDKCYEEINNAIQRTMTEPQTLDINMEEVNTIWEIASDDIKSAARKDKVVVELPARVNFGGGWSDTPPYSIENGGTVLNAAISLNGKLPIKVTAEFIKEPVVRFISKDLDINTELKYLSELQNYDDPTDPLALHKAALVVTGIIPAKTLGRELNLKTILMALGGGISICTEVDIPKGSGLGTSSILAAAVLKAINELVGLPYNDQKIFDQVLCLEQILTTGGGWQDQVGGFIPGVKMITSKPGLPQKIEYDELKLDTDTLKELNERFVLVYTGQRRLAKGILREIMGEYIINNPLIFQCLSDIQKLALLMRYELEKGNIDGFAQLLNEHWELSKKLDAGCTNSYINQILEISKPYTLGAMICGAGGGGFLQLILKDACEREALRKALQNVFQDNNVGIWDCEIL